jgi:hypothetical protein
MAAIRDNVSDAAFYSEVKFRSHGIARGVVRTNS